MDGSLDGLQYLIEHEVDANAKDKVNDAMRKKKVCFSVWLCGVCATRTGRAECLCTIFDSSPRK